MQTINITTMLYFAVELNEGEKEIRLIKVVPFLYQSA